MQTSVFAFAGRPLQSAGVICLPRGFCLIARLLFAARGRSFWGRRVLRRKFALCARRGKFRVFLQFAYARSFTLRRRGSGFSRLAFFRVVRNFLQSPLFIFSRIALAGLPRNPLRRNCRNRIFPWAFCARYGRRGGVRRVRNLNLRRAGGCARRIGEVREAEFCSMANRFARKLKRNVDCARRKFYSAANSFARRFWAGLERANILRIFFSFELFFSFSRSLLAV